MKINLIERFDWDDYLSTIVQFVACNSILIAKKIPYTYLKKNTIVDAGKIILYHFLYGNLFSYRSPVPVTVLGDAIDKVLWRTVNMNGSIFFMIFYKGAV